MTACWCRLIQPENSRTKKVSGGGSRSMAGACLSAERRSTDARLAKIPEVGFLQRRGPVSRQIRPSAGFSPTGGVRHSVEVTADSLYEAAIFGVALLRKDGWAEQ